MRATFTKAERITSRKVIDQLFRKEKGSTDGKQPAARTFYLFPFRLLYMDAPAPVSGVDNPEASTIGSPNATIVSSSQVLPAILITVSKRNFKRAVDRNRIRRRIREAYRLNKSFLFGTTDKPKFPPAYITFIYTVKTEISFEEIEKGMKLALTRIN